MSDPLRHLVETWRAFASIRHAESKAADAGYSALLRQDAERAECCADALAAVLDALPQPEKGVGLIAAERQRQVSAEGWTPDHDDTHDRGELLGAAVCYVREVLGDWVGFNWPWGRDSWKPSPEPIRNLVKAGALIAAEIDRLQRQRSGSSGAVDPAERPVCAVCGKPAACLGAYDMAETPAYACDACCGHGNEDGRCVPLDEAAEFVKRFDPAERTEER